MSTHITGRAARSGRRRAHVPSLAPLLLAAGIGPADGRAAAAEPVATAVAGSEPRARQPSAAADAHEADPAWATQRSAP
ncbi:hypothetical protein OG372_29030 [Streptomyces sp. NBC_01020]|uniref:hypothetical protein n=1 Tax=unclassified Streptomyces TaxID=2593676 RepID=UPI00324B1ABF|nr:hypothetical protein OG372_29030 [Streptomyces sp. NBC_01020]